MKEKDIYLIRHGQTTLNAEGKALGQSDIGLTKEGVEEVERLAQHLSGLGVRPDRIYTSPLVRAKRTAQLLQNSLGGVIEENEVLREINYGIYEGKDKQFMRKIGYGYYSQKMIEGRGETVEELEQKIKHFLNFLLQIDDSSVLIVTHAFTASVIAQIMMGVPRTFPNIQPLSTADYSHFRVEKGGENVVNILSIQRNCLKGLLNI